jgi:hypothetical protein
MFLAPDLLSHYRGSSSQAFHLLCALLLVWWLRFGAVRQSRQKSQVQSRGFAILDFPLVSDFSVGSENEIGLKPQLSRGNYEVDLGVVLL